MSDRSLPARSPRRGEPVPASEFVTPPTAAAWLGVPVPAVLEAAERGAIPAIRDGTTWRFHGPTLRRFIDTAGDGDPTSG